ncbi:hypothetical protein [Ekhidna sp.]|uniref:hypothetical protein n=1 Tax=Ekhidna sp. TaxID=2608089 RepID=UPI003297D78F
MIEYEIFKKRNLFYFKIIEDKRTVFSSSKGYNSSTEAAEAAEIEVNSRGGGTGSRPKK